MTRTRLATLLASALFCAGFVWLAYALKQSSPNRNDAKLQEIRSFADTVPVPPFFRMEGENSSSRSMYAGIYRYYRSSAHPEMVDEFYSARLSKLGWTRDEVDKLTFSKGDMVLVIDHSAAKDPDWDYGISLVWRSNMLR